MEAQKCCLGCRKWLDLSDFYPHPKGLNGLQARCKACERDRLQVRKHGVTREQKAAIAAAQGGCAICSAPSPGAKGWVVDHDRGCCPGDASCSKCRRGVLCQWCNSALGYAKDNPEVLRRMADYLERGDRIGPQ